MARIVLPTLLAVLSISTGFAASAAKASSLYVIDGFVLGEQAEPGRDYRCEPARLSSNFTWCERTRQERTRRGSFNSTMSILSDQNGDAVYVNRAIEPAFFGPTEMSSEIARLSSRFGERPREMRLPPRDDVPANVIAVWGKLQLEPLDAAALAALDPEKMSAQDMLLDPLGDLKRSMELKLPVYRLGGGAGYLWAGAHANGRGHLRFLMADPSSFVAKPATATAQPGTTPLASAQSKSTSLAVAHPVPALSGAAAVAPAPDNAGNVPVNMSVRAKSTPDPSLPVLSRNEVEQAVLLSERLAPEHTGSIAFAPGRVENEAPSAPSLHRLETTLALAGLAAALVFFLGSLIERLLREPTGLELLEMERRRELAAELAEQQGVDALNCVRPEGRLAELRDIAARAWRSVNFDGLRSVVVRLPASARRA
jgi:hypothetical protein